MLALVAFAFASGGVVATHSGSSGHCDAPGHDPEDPDSGHEDHGEGEGLGHCDGSMSLTKSASGTATAVGDVITYTLIVGNTGAVTLTGVSVSDPLLVTFTRGTDNPGDNDTALEVGETWLFTGSYALLQADLDFNGRGTGFIDSTLTADSKQTEPPVSHSQAVRLRQNPVIDVVKWNDATDATGVGDTITYRYRVTNSGNLTLTDLTLIDDQEGTLTLSATALAPDADATATALHVVTQADVDARIPHEHRHGDGHAAQRRPDHGAGQQHGEAYAAAIPGHDQRRQDEQRDHRDRRGRHNHLQLYGHEHWRRDPNRRDLGGRRRGHADLEHDDAGAGRECSRDGGSRRDAGRV